VLIAGFRDLGITFDLTASRRIVLGAYRQVARAEGQAWVEGTLLRPLEEGWEVLLTGGGT
jgi:hypothetical protein